jgi:hypothetical protein
VIVAFLGPSFSGATGGIQRRPPARQGDVWRALHDGAKAIALIDGVFEQAPSVWHHEILDALAEGVPVFGGASMGALRAAELQKFGMVGVGQIFRWYASGEIIDDAEVALLHADAEHQFRPLTIPQVNVRWSALQQLPRREAKRVIEASANIFYQDRTIDRVRAIAPGLKLIDRKALDAQEVLEAVRHAMPLPRIERNPSSLVMRRRLEAIGAAPQPESLLQLIAREWGLRLSDEELLENASRLVNDGPALPAGDARTTGRTAARPAPRRARRAKRAR